MSAFDVVFFDIGSTLIPSAEIIARAASHACQRLALIGLIPDANAFLLCYQHADATVDPPHISHIYSDTRIIVKAEELAGVPPDTRRVTFFLHAYREAMRVQIQASEELVELFAALAHAGVQRGIISDGSVEGQSEVLFRLGLLPHISPKLCLISEAVGVTKSDPEIYHRALAIARVEPARALMIGDRLDLDVGVPRSIGMQAVLLRVHRAPAFIRQDLATSSLAIQPEQQFDTWAELRAWLKTC